MEELSSLLKALEKGRTEFEDEARSIQHMIWQSARSQAGPLYDQMIANREFAISCLEHADANVCKAAMSIFAQRVWPATRQVEEICQRIARIGPPDIRASAVVSLSLICNQLHDRKVSETLGEFALDPEIPEDTRTAAYLTLRRMFGPVDDRSLPRDSREISASDKAVDPKIVRECINRDKVSRLM